MRKTIKKLSMFFVMVVLAISFSIPFMLFPSKVYADVSGPFTYAVNGGATATITGYNVSGGTAVTIPLTLGGYPVTSIGDGSSALNTAITSVTFTTPSNVTSIGNRAFYVDTDLTSITLPEGLTSIGDSAFSHDTGLTSISIPSTVTSIGQQAFYSCTGLTSITLPEGLTSISYSAFSYDTGLTSITIPSTVTSIGAAAFFDTGLTSITIPSTVTSIGNAAFRDCSNLETVTFKGETATTFGTDSFLNIKSGAIANVPAGTIGTGYLDNVYPFGTGNPLTLTESPADSPDLGGSSTPRALTPDEWVTQNLNIDQLVNHYGATPLGFLGMLYDNCMLRIPDASGLNYWDEQLTDKVFGANFVVEHFIFSEEIGAKVAAMSNVEYVNFLYSTLFARIPDIDGYNNWLGYINSGFSKEETLRVFLNNEEWINICKMFNVTP